MLPGGWRLAGCSFELMAYPESLPAFAGSRLRSAPATFSTIWLAALSECQGPPSIRHLRLDVGGYTGSLPEGRNLMAGLIRLERSRIPEEVEAVLAAFAEWLSGPEHEGLRRALGEWIRQVHAPARRPGMEWPALNDWSEDRPMLYETVKEWTAQWLAEGRVEGQAEVMRRQAARKFGVVTPDRLAEELERVQDPERVVEIGEWLIKCESGEELLDRVRGKCMAAVRPDGDDAASPRTPFDRSEGGPER